MPFVFCVTPFVLSGVGAITSTTLLRLWSQENKTGQILHGRESAKPFKVSA